MKSYDINGFSINMAFRDIVTVRDAILRSSIHRIYTKGVEFAIAVYARPLGSGLLSSVWVYAACLQRVSA